MSKIIHPKKFFKILDVKVSDDDADKILNACFGFLMYLKVGQKIQTNTATYEKIASDLVQIQPKINLEKSVVKSLEKTRVIRIPV